MKRRRRIDIPRNAKVDVILCLLMLAKGTAQGDFAECEDFFDVPEWRRIALSDMRQLMAALEERTYSDPSVVEIKEWLVDLDEDAFIHSFERTLQ